MGTWTQLCLTTARENAELCAQLLMDCGCVGVQIDDVVVLLDESEDATLAPKADATITGHFAPEHFNDRVTALLHEALCRNNIPARIEVSPLEQQDWSASWRENFPPL